MARNSYEDFLRKQHPGIDKVAELYAELGMSDPLGWAASEINGKKHGIALALFSHALRDEVMVANDTAWPHRVQTGELNIDASELLDAARESLRQLQATGVNLKLVTPLLRLFQAQTIRNVVGLLDEGSRLCRVQPPAGREADWELVAVDVNRRPIGTLSGLHELLDDV